MLIFAKMDNNIALFIERCKFEHFFCGLDLRHLRQFPLDFRFFSAKKKPGENCTKN